MLPVILAHGYLGFSQIGPFSYFNHVKQMLAQGGIQDVHATDVNPKGSLQSRSQELTAQIRQLVPNGNVHVIAHSMGGLDARYLIARGGRDMIQTLITLGTPFHGTLAADIAANPRQLAGVSVANLVASVEEFVAATTIRWPFTVAADTHFAITQLRQAIAGLGAGDYGQLASYFSGLFSLQDSALQELTTGNCARLFPSDCSDLAGVKSYSLAGRLQPADVSPPLTVPALVLAAAGQANDGVVPVDSATLPAHLGTLACDHFGLVGWTPHDVSACYRQICQILLAG